MSGTVLSHFKFIISFNPHSNHVYFYYFLPHFIEKKMRHMKIQMIYPESHS